MRINNFEKHFAEKMNEYPSKLDTDALWETLESDLDKKKKRRIVLIILTLFLMLAIGGITLFQFQTTKNQFTPSTICLIEDLNSLIHESNSPLENPSKFENKSSIADSKISNSSQANHPQKTGHTVQVASNEHITTANYVVDANTNPSSINSQTISSVTTPKPVLENNDPQILRKSNIEKIAPLDLSKIDLPKKENDLILIETSPNIRRGKSWSLYITPTFGVFYTDRKVAQKNESGATLKGLRELSETPLETLSLGIGIELKNKDDFFLTGGVNFNQITERFDHQSSEFTTENIEIITEINYLSTGERQEVMGIYEQPQEIITTTKVYNTLRWTEFTVGGGYYFTRKRLNLGASAGLLWGTMLNTDGKIFDAENNIIEIGNQNPGIYKSNLGLGAFANLEARYTLNSRMRLSAQFGYKHMPSSFTPQEYPLDIKYQWWGATVGLHYKIY